MKLTNEQFEILDHTLNRAARRMFCGDSEDMRILVEKGLMKSAGKAPFCPDEYFTITKKGEELYIKQRAAKG